MHFLAAYNIHGDEPASIEHIGIFGGSGTLNDNRNPLARGRMIKYLVRPTPLSTLNTYPVRGRSTLNSSSYAVIHPGPSSDLDLVDAIAHPSLAEIHRHAGRVAQNARLPYRLPNQSLAHTYCESHRKPSP